MTAEKIKELLEKSKTYQEDDKLFFLILNDNIKIDIACTNNSDVSVSEYIEYIISNEKCINMINHNIRTYQIKELLTCSFDTTINITPTNS
jgi:hypothetical protein